jgi:RNA polymerase sigma factor (sigma-70 family)
MSNIQFSDGMKLLLQRHPALPAARTRELGAAFQEAQEKVCAPLGALRYPLDRIASELKSGNLPYFREGSDRDQKAGAGKKNSYRFAGMAPSHIEEWDRHVAEIADGKISADQAAARRAAFLMRFTFDVIEQVALRAYPAPVGGESASMSGPGAATGPAPSPAHLRRVLESALTEARRIRDEMLAGNLLLVAKIVLGRARFNTTVVLDDLFTAGTDGLMIAISRYDPKVGQFSTYATPWIKMAIDRYVAKTSHVIRLPIGLQEKVRRERREGASLVAGQADAPTVLPEVQSLEEPMPGFADGDLRLEDIVADAAGTRPREAAESADIARILHDRLKKLDALKQFIVSMRSDIGDAASLGARLFREEIALSLSRGRATAAAAATCLEEPARLRMIGGSFLEVVEEPSQPEELALAM